MKRLARVEGRDVRPAGVVDRVHQLVVEIDALEADLAHGVGEFRDRPETPLIDERIGQAPEHAPALAHLKVQNISDQAGPLIRGTLLPGLPNGEALAVVHDRHPAREGEAGGECGGPGVGVANEHAAGVQALACGAEVADQIGTRVPVPDREVGGADDVGLGVASPNIGADGAEARDVLGAGERLCIGINGDRTVRGIEVEPGTRDTSGAGEVFAERGISRCFGCGAIEDGLEERGHARSVLDAVLVAVVAGELWGAWWHGSGGVAAWEGMKFVGECARRMFVAGRVGAARWPARRPTTTPT